ncbi:F-box only protein 15 isoform X3 [Mauremys reevesii]|uniref:F-box only protein 15 isoform X3 n=1 Tax=Mauremys reevesii TaxID=260615 RepID=UPI00193FCF7E|nr:F-box only protein 15 isoform X3 [Mauremys reevesii]
MATGRGWILQQHSLGLAWAAAAPQRPAPPVLPSRSPPTSAAPPAGPDRGSLAVRLSKRSGIFTAMSAKLSETQNVRIQRHYQKSFMKSKFCLCIESMPSEILLKIFSYLDAVSLLCIGCVNKRFYHLANDKTNWKTNSVERTAVLLSHATIQDRESGYWKNEYIMKQIATGKTRIFQLLKPINPSTGLPLKTKEAIKTYSLRWVIVLKDRNGKEHVMEQVDISYNDTSITVFWYGTNWPCLDTLSTLELCGVTPLLLDQCKVPTKNGPRRRSLIAEFNLSNLTKVTTMIGSDMVVQLFRLNPGLLVGLWKKGNGIAFVMASLHHHQLIERSTLGSATIQYILPPHKPILDDVDPEYGLHGYQLHIDMHSGGHTYICGTFRNLFCRKEYIRNGYLRLTVISLKNNSQHLPLAGKVGFFWRTDVFEGNVQNCYMMDVTLLDETEKPFWCFSAPVYMKLSSKASCLYDYMGHNYDLNYMDSEGKVHVELVWIEESKEYYIVNLVLYLSTEKVNRWFGTKY